MLDILPTDTANPIVYGNTAVNYYVVTAITTKTTANIIALATENGEYIEAVAVDVSPAGSTFIENDFWNIVEPLEPVHPYAWGNQLGFIVDSKEAKLALQRREFYDAKQPYLESGDFWINYKYLYTSRWMSLRKVTTLENTGRLNLMGLVDIPNVKEDALRQALCGLATLVGKDPFNDI